MIKGIRPTLAEGGKIKIGGLGDKKKSRSGSDYRLPVKHDRFTVTTTLRDDNDELIVDTAIMEALGESPTEIPVVLHSDELDEVFPTRYARYSGRKLQCSGDGETATDHHGDVKDCPCVELEKRRCKPSGTLYCSISLPGLAVAGSVHKWRTTSIISIAQMVGSLQHIRQTVGVLQGLPLTLCMGPRQVSPDGKPTTVYVCWLELRAKDVGAVQTHALELAERRSQVRQLASAPEYRQLVAASESDPIDVEAREFYPVEPPPELPPEPVPEPQESPRDAVLRIGKGFGFTKSEMQKIIAPLELGPADRWTPETVALVRDKFEENLKREERKE